IQGEAEQESQATRHEDMPLGFSALPRPPLERHRRHEERHAGLGDRNHEEVQEMAATSQAINPGGKRSIDHGRISSTKPRTLPNEPDAKLTIDGQCPDPAASNGQCSVLTPAGAVGLLGVFTEFERAMIQERVKAGMARAKAEG